jgi:hypothetical protein
LEPTELRVIAEMEWIKKARIKYHAYEEFRGTTKMEWIKKARIKYHAYEID